MNPFLRAGTTLAAASFVFGCLPKRPVSRASEASEETWTADFAAAASDPEGDDASPGAGRYLYPQGVPAGSGDLRSFALSYRAAEKTLQIAIGLTKVSEFTRVGLMLQDSIAHANAGADFCIGGIELRAPFWNGHGVNFLVSAPREKSTLFDYNVTHPNPAGAPRFDNVAFVSHEPSEWLLPDGSATGRAEAEPYRLNTELVSEEGSDLLRFSIPVEMLRPYIDTRSDVIYARLYSYLTVPGERMEYGGYEVKGVEGGGDGWEDPDAYDIAFVQEGGLPQSQILAGYGSGVDGVVMLREVGQGVLAIPTR